MKTFPAFLVMALLTACSSPTPPIAAPVSMAQCAKDTDCKGDRICEKGMCQAPVSVVATQPVSSTVENKPDHSEKATPDFADYPTPIYAGPVGKVDLSSEEGRMYKTRLQEAMTDTVAFGGEYALMTMGCGSSGCIHQMFVSRKTGRILSPSFSSYSALGIVDKKGEDVRMGETLEGMQPDSGLLVVQGLTDPDEDATGNSAMKAEKKFYVLDGEKLKLIKTLVVPPPLVQPIPQE